MALGSPYRSPLGVYYRSPLGVRGGGLGVTEEVLYPTADAWLDDSPTDWNYGALTNSRLGGEGGLGRHRFVVKFDVSGISAAAIASATLRLYIHAYPASVPLTIYTARLLRDWNEGSGTSSPASAGEVTFQSAKYGSVSWTSWGADSQGNDRTAPGPGTAFGLTSGWKELDVTDFAEDWIIDSDPNYGLLVYSPTDSTDAGFYQLYTREVGLPTLRPQLVIQYTP